MQGYPRILSTCGGKLTFYSGQRLSELKHKVVQMSLNLFKLTQCHMVVIGKNLRMSKKIIKSRLETLIHLLILKELQPRLCSFCKAEFFCTIELYHIIGPGDI